MDSIRLNVHDDNFLQSQSLKNGGMPSLWHLLTNISSEDWNSVSLLLCIRNWGCEKKLNVFSWKTYNPISQRSNFWHKTVIFSCYFIYSVDMEKAECDMKLYKCCLWFSDKIKISCQGLARDSATTQKRQAQKNKNLPHILLFSQKKRLL